jgi:hypothetical protein
MDGSNFFKGTALLAGDNTFEIDKHAISLLGVPEPAYVRVAREIGAGSDDFKIIEIGTKPSKKTCKIDGAQYKQALRIRLWANPRACSMCRFLFHDIRSFSSNDFRYRFRIGLRLVRLAFTGAEIVMGSEPI